MQESFTKAVSNEANWTDGKINWNFVDADMFKKWSVLLDGETYTAWFDKVADEVEGVAA